eukprot:TRINITY_DN317_c0_g1_i3.p2 TRINITY_DN317_c0_g1~~TRINITY_DN317_c0_g1_i3.p2  ORF type:complete len:116 (-),score=37.44 TRINITY_DN317_c0_g1_i3:6-353(-)
MLKKDDRIWNIKVSEIRELASDVVIYGAGAATWVSGVELDRVRRELCLGRRRSQRARERHAVRLDRGQPVVDGDRKEPRRHGVALGDPTLHSFFFSKKKKKKKNKNTKKKKCVLS